MKFSYTGKSGIRVSQICLGTMTFGHGTDKKEAEHIVHEAVDYGVNFFDTANSYSQGTSEAFLGEALQGIRDKAVIATKFSNPMGDGANDSGWSRKHIMKAAEDSLRRLKTDYIDVYYIHHTDNYTSVHEVLRALDDLVRQGKVRAVGCSNFEGWRLSDFLWTSEMKNLTSVVCYEGAYSLVMRDAEQEIFPICRNWNVGFTAFWVLAGGFLTGKYKPGQRVLPGTRSGESWNFHTDHFSQNADEILRVLFDVSNQLDCSPASAATAWVMSRPEVSSVLIGARTLEQLRNTLPAAGLTLPDEVAARLEKVSRLQLRYPYWQEADQQQKRESAVKHRQQLCR